MQRKLNAIPGVRIPDDALDKRPSISLQALTDPAALEAFLTVLDWSLDKASTAGKQHLQSSESRNAPAATL